MTVIARNCRVTLQRQGDAKFFHGWITDLTDDLIVVFARIPEGISASEEFHFHIFGHESEVLIQARYASSSLGMRTIASLGEANAGSEYQHHFFETCGAPKVIPSTGSARFRVDGFSAELIDLEFGIPEVVQLADISLEGLGIVGQIQHEKKERGKLVFTGISGDIVAHVEVRYSVPHESGSLFRTGLRIVQMSRLDKGRFDTLWRSILELNVVRLQNPAAAA